MVKRGGMLRERPSDPLCGVVLNEEQNLVIQEAYSRVDFLNGEGASCEFAS